MIPEKSGAVEYAETDQELVKKAAEILSSPDKQQKLAIKGYEFAMKNHAWPVFMDKLEGYLKKYTKK
mgnify:CR=1 FL=1